MICILLSKGRGNIQGQASAGLAWELGNADGWFSQFVLSLVLAGLPEGKRCVQNRSRQLLQENDEKVECRGAFEDGRRVV